MNTNYGRVNGYYVYLYDGPRVPEFDRPGVANVDKYKFKVSVFLGIPYAQSPTGEARLMVSTYVFFIMLNYVSFVTQKQYYYIGKKELSIDYHSMFLEW